MTGGRPGVGKANPESSSVPWTGVTGEDGVAVFDAAAGLLVEDRAPAEPFTRGCTVAGRSVGESCGEPVDGAVLVYTYALPLSEGINQAPQARGMLVCRRHFAGLTGAPPFPPDGTDQQPL